MENKNWQDEAVKDSGIKVPEWELEPTGAEQKETMEAAVEIEPSVAEKRLEELKAETKEVAPENLEQKSAQVETTRAEIAEMAPEIPLEKPQIQEAPRVSMEKIRISLTEGLPRKTYGNFEDGPSKLLAEAAGLDRKAIEDLRRGEEGYTSEQWKTIEQKLLNAENGSLDAIKEYAGKGAEKRVQKFAGYKKGETENTLGYYEDLLREKEYINKDNQKKLAFGAGSAAGIAGATAMGATVLGASSAVISGIILSGGGVLVTGGAAWIGKKLWDEYKVNKARRNYAKAQVSATAVRNIRGSSKS